MVSGVHSKISALAAVSCNTEHVVLATGVFMGVDVGVGPWVIANLVLTIDDDNDPIRKE